MNHTHNWSGHLGTAVSFVGLVAQATTVSSFQVLAAIGAFMGGSAALGKLCWDVYLTIRRDRRERGRG